MLATNRNTHKKVWMVYPVHTLIWYASIVDSGPHISLPFLVDLPLPLEIYKTFYFTGLNP